VYLLYADCNAYFSLSDVKIAQLCQYTRRLWLWNTRSW